MKNDAVKIFEGRDVRSVWDAEAEKWYISIVDVMSVLTDSVDGRKYWNKLKQRLREEGNESVTNCHQLKLSAADGKKYLTDVADVEQLFRLIQSVPSPDAKKYYLCANYLLWYVHNFSNPFVAGVSGDSGGRTL